MRRTRLSDPVIYVLAAALALTIAVAILVSASALKMSGDIKEKDAAVSEISAKIDEKNQLLSEQQSALEAYEQQISDLLTQTSDLHDEAEALREEIDGLSMLAEALGEENAVDAEALTILREQLQRMEDTLKEKNALLEHYKKLVESNHGVITEKISELFGFLYRDIPDYKQIFLENGEVIPPVEPEHPVESKVAYYYRDLTTDYSVAYNEDEILYSASLIKAPYVYCILEEIAAFEADRDPVVPYLPEEEKYDLTREWVYDKASMFKEGSGEIRNMDDGTVLTYRQLVEYTLLYSDNIAFSELRKVFGMDSFYSKVSELGIRGTANGFMQLSASDCAKFLEQMYAFFETESPYAALMKDCMIRSMHNVMIVSGLWGTTVAHKYGWDSHAYHDMGIVYDENPYILVIMTNLESGGDEVNSYIQKLTRLTAEIHNSLHH